MCLEQAWGRSRAMITRLPIFSFNNMDSDDQKVNYFEAPIPWVRITLLTAAVVAFVTHVGPALWAPPINRTLEVSARSTEVPGSTTVTLQLHQDGSVTWQRPPTMDDRVWFLPKLGIEQTHVPSTPKPLPPPSQWVEETLKKLNDNYDPNK